MPHVRAAIVALGVVLVATAASAQQPDVLVSTTWLAEHLHEDRLVVLHVGSTASHAAGHIPGARLLPFARFAVERDGLSTELPALETLRAALEEVGVAGDSRIVVYGTTQPQTLAARLWVTLRHLGLDAVLLDGGLPAWLAEARAVGTNAPDVRRTTLQVQPRSDVFVDVEYVRQQISDTATVIVDARDEPFWSGAQRNQQRAARAGRIPGARNVPFSSLVDASGRLLDQPALAARFRNAGIEPGQTLIVYCHVGQQASLLFAAAALLGFEVRLYDGSFEEWSRRTDLPVQTDGDGAVPVHADAAPV